MNLTDELAVLKLLVDRKCPFSGETAAVFLLFILFISRIIVRNYNLIIIKIVGGTVRIVGGF